MTYAFDRRNFLRASAAGAAGIAFGRHVYANAPDKNGKLRLAGKTVARSQKKRAVSTRPFGREAKIVPRNALICNGFMGGLPLAATRKPAPLTSSPERAGSWPGGAA